MIDAACGRTRCGSFVVGLAHPSILLTTMGISRAMQFLLSAAILTGAAHSPLPLRKLGLYLPGFYETTPVVLRGRLLLVECIHAGRPMLASPKAAASEPFQNHTYYRIREPGYDGALVVPVVPQSVGFHFVSALVVSDHHAEDMEALWVFGTVDPPLGGGPYGRTQIFAWSSHDSGLRYWNRSLALQLPPGYSAWNTDVAPVGKNGSFVMAIELQAPANVVGVPFSTAFAVCDGCGSDLSIGWRLLDASAYLFTKARYNACPTIRYVPSDGYYYLLTLFSSVPPGNTFDTVIVRSKNLTSGSWSPTPTAPQIVLAPDNQPGSIEHRPMPGSTLDLCGDECQRWNGSVVPPKDVTGTAFRANAINYTDIDASDIDFVQLPNGSTYVVYCTGNQQYGYAYNAAAMVDSSVQAWLQSFFDEKTVSD
eukprot:COSAG02_NODE_7039_length_3214_cov_14.690851_4_plen_423_part_00